MTSIEKLGLAVVGSAGIIGRNHVQVISRLDSARLVGVTDVDTETAQGQAAESGVRFYPSLEDLLSDPEVDAVTIATPHPFHPTIAVEALRAGKHVLSEKPMAVTPSQADAMITAARDAGLTLAVLFPQRFQPEMQRIHSLIQEGVLGEIYRTSLVQTGARTQFYYDAGGWRGTWDKEGGGVLVNQAPHYLDVFQWLAGLPRTAYGAVRTMKHAIEAEDYASALLEYESGAQGMCHFSTVQAPSQVRLELWGERGAIVLSDGQLTLHRLEMPLSQFIKTDRSQVFARINSQAESLTLESPRDAREATVDDFARAVLEGREPAVPGEEGIKSVELAAAIILSSCRGVRVELPVDREEYDGLLEELKGLRSLPRP